MPPFGAILLAAILAVGLAGSALLAAVRFWAAEPSGRLRVGFCGAVFVGLAVAFWGGFWVEYQHSPTVRVHGFPLPIVVFVLQKGDWVPFDSAALPLLLLNSALVTSLVPLPLSLALIARGTRRRRLEPKQGFPVVQP